MSDEPHPMQTVTDILFGRGWSSTLPPAVVVLFGELASSGPITRTALDSMLRAENPDTPDGLDSSVWEPLELWTEEKLAELDEDFGEPDEPRTTDELNAQDKAQRELDQADFARYLASKNLPVSHTFGALVDLLVSCNVLSANEAGGLFLNPQAPLPAEVLPLDAREAARQDKIRWERLHERAAQEIIRLFRTDEQEVDHILVSLDQLAKELESDPEDVRSAVKVLTDEGDFSTSIDIERAHPQQSFVLHVDWDVFNRNRIHVSFAPPTSE